MPLLGDQFTDSTVLYRDARFAIVINIASDKGFGPANAPHVVAIAHMSQSSSVSGMYLHIMRSACCRSWDTWLILHRGMWLHQADCDFLSSKLLNHRHSSVSVSKSMLVLRNADYLHAGDK